MALVALAGCASSEGPQGLDRPFSPEPAPVGDPREIRESQSLYQEENMARALSALRRRVGGSSARMLKVTVLPWLAEFHLRRGEGAYGFQWLAKERELRRVQVRVVGTGSLDDEDFALERVSADAPRRLAARVREEERSWRAAAMSLERVPPDGYLLWEITGEGPGRTGLVWHANPAGRGFAELPEFARRNRSGRK